MDRTSILYPPARVFSFLFFTLMTLNAQAAVSIDVTGTVVSVPECTINGGNEISVKFDDAMTTKIDGINYAKPVLYSLNCPGLLSNLIALQISGTASSFDSSLLETTNSNLGIKFLAGSTLLPVNTNLNFDYRSGAPTLTAVPQQKAGATLDGGDFSATATMKILFQ